MKITKRVFFMVALIMLIITLSSAVSAADDTTTDSIISESPTDTTVEPVTTISSDTTIKNENKIINKTTRENVKTATKTVEVNNYDELTSTINSAVKDSDNDEYVINLNAGTYQITSNVRLEPQWSSPNIIINANNQTLTGSTNSRTLYFANKCNITINNATINHRINSNVNIAIYHSTINNRVTINDQSLTLGDDVIFGDNFSIAGSGNIISNNPNISNYLSNLNGTYTIENRMMTTSKTNYGNLTIRNATVNTTLNNYGNMIICDDVIFAENSKIFEYSPITINGTSRILPYMFGFNGNYSLENRNVTVGIINSGILSLKNFTLQGVTNNANSNITIRDSTILNTILNRGTFFIENSTIDATVINTGIIILGDNITLGSKFSLSNGGEILSNDTDLLAPYITKYTGSSIIENKTLTGEKTNNGNLTLRNCTTDSFINNGNLTAENSTLNGKYTNNGILSVINSTLNQEIENNGVLIVEGDIEFGPSFYLSGDGEIRGDEESLVQLFPYVQSFYGEATLVLGNYSAYHINNSGKLVIENSTLGEGWSWALTNNLNAELTLKNTTNNMTLSNYGRTELINVTQTGPIWYNYGTLIISDDTILNFTGVIIGDGEIIINDTQRIADYLTIYTGNIVLTNKTINGDKINKGTLTLNNCTIQQKIVNNGRIIIDNNTVFERAGKITGSGEIITDNITRILPYIDTINGNHTITDTTLNKTYTFNGNVTLNNCTITNPDNGNFGTLYLNNCTVNVGENNVFLDNMGTVYIDRNTQITGQIENLGGEVIVEETYEPKTYVVTNRTVKYYFDLSNNGKLMATVNPGDTLDFQGTISGNPNIKRLCVDKPINIISSTNDAVIDLNTTNGDLSGANPGNTFTITKDGAYTNVTGITFHNTQLWLYNTNHVTLDNISAIVEDQTVGSGVGQTSIRANSTYITVKNSYFYTRNNGGSSTLVLAWGDYCTLVNNTVVGVGNVGNLIYLTTYNVEIPRNITYNSHNIIANNTLTGPQQAAAICWGIVLSGTDNLVDGNIMTFNGSGVNVQWGSGSGDGEGEGLFNISGNTIRNNKLLGNCGLMGGDIIYNNYIENGTIKVSNALAYNNTATSLTIDEGNSEVRDNIINGDVTATNDKIKTSFIVNNTINGNIEIGSRVYNITFIENNITGTVTLDGSNNTFINNRIISEDEYTIQSRKGKDNIIRDNYLLATENAGDDSVNLKDSSNIIENNLPINTNIEIIAANEVTVNTSTPVIIIVTRKDQLTTEDITLTINEQNETVTAKNGIILIQYTPNTVGDQEITATFAGYGDYITSTSTATIKVTPDKDAIIEELNNTVQQASKDCVLTIDTIPDIKFNDNLTIYGKLMDTKGTGISGEKVTVNVNGADNTVTTDANGVWKLKIKTTTLGTNNVTATYNGAAYNPFTTSTTFQIAQTEAIITIDKIVTTQFRDNVTITGTFKNSNGKVIANSKVRVNVNGYSTYVITDHDGVWSLTIKTNKTGVNNVTASFTGNANYAKYTANATFNVTKQDLIITTDVSFKQGNFTITGSFVDKNGNKLANSKVRVNINGKAVYVKTDSNGTYTYSEMITAKTIKYNVYYGGSANYNSFTTSKTTLTVA